MKTLICVVGPTAVGKTSLGIRLAHEFGAEVISADSRQIYKGMEIGTAAPTADEQSQARHHFVGLRDVVVVVVAASMTTTMPRDLHSPPPPPPLAPPLTAFPPPSPTTTAVESPPPPAPIGTPAPELGVNEAFEYVVFSVITVFVILYSVYLALIREDDEEEDEERDAEEGGRERRTANIDDDIDNDTALPGALGGRGGGDAEGATPGRH